MDVNTRNRTELKSYFVKNSIPTETNFAELIDGMLNQRDDGVVKLVGGPLSLEAVGDAASQKRAIDLYRSFADDTLDWTISLNPRSDPKEANTAQLGFSISDREGNSRLFVDRNNGNVGIGTVQPKHRLHVSGNAQVNNAFVGDVGHGAGWAGFSHSSAATPNSYGLLQSTNGQSTLINKKSGGGTIALRVDNVDRVVMNDAGNIGIGTNDPRQQLTIVGNFNQGRDPANNMSNGGNIAIKGNAPQIDFIDTDNNDWSIHVNSNKLYFIRQPWESTDLVLDGTGNVGIGTASPIGKLQVSGNGGVLNIEGQNHAYMQWYPMTVAGGRKGWMGYWPASSTEMTIKNDAGKLTVSGSDNNLTVPGTVIWGNFGSNSLTRDNAGLQGNAGAKSGFFETSAPAPAANWYAGASGWQHMIDVRHSNAENNHALQIAGSFFDQNLYFRKTNNSPSQGWNRILAENSSGNVGIGTSTPVAKLQVVGGAIMPAAGNTSQSGIYFPPDPGGGSGDEAWVRYYSRYPSHAELGFREQTTLEIGVGNDPNDHLSFRQWGSERMRLDTGRLLLFQIASNADAASILGRAETPNGTMMFGTWGNGVYIYFKDDVGRIGAFRMTATGAAPGMHSAVGHTNV